MRKLFTLIALLILITTDAAAQRFVKSFNVLQDMISVNPNDLNNAAMCSGLTTAGDGTGGLFYYNASSTAATNTVDVFKPLTFAGRWIRIPTTTFNATTATISNAFIGTLTITNNLNITNGTASRALILDSLKNITNSVTTAAELAFVSGVTSGIQAQIDAKGVGTVTSVGLTVPSFLSVAGSPVTGASSLAVTLSGTALPVANGGSGATTLTGILRGAGTGAFTGGTVLETDFGFTDITTANVSTSKHGLTPKLSGNATDFLNGLGVFSVPSGGGGSGTNYTFSPQFGITSATNVFIASASKQTNNLWYSGSTQVAYIYTGHPQLLIGDGSTEGDAGFPFLASALNSGYGITLCTLGGYGEWIVNQTAIARFDSRGLKLLGGTAANPPFASTVNSSSGGYWPDASTFAISGGGIKDASFTASSVTVHTNLYGTDDSGTFQVVRTVATPTNATPSGGSSMALYWTVPNHPSTITNTTALSSLYYTNDVNYFVSDPSGASNSIGSFFLLHNLGKTTAKIHLSGFLYTQAAPGNLTVNIAQNNATNLPLTIIPIVGSGAFSLPANLSGAGWDLDADMMFNVTSSTNVNNTVNGTFFIHDGATGTEYVHPIITQSPVGTYYQPQTALIITGQFSVASGNGITTQDAEHVIHGFGIIPQAPN